MGLGLRGLLVVGRRDSLNGLGQCGEVDTFDVKNAAHARFLGSNSAGA